MRCFNNRPTGQGITYRDGAQVNVTGFSVLDNIDSGNPFNVGQDAAGTYSETTTNYLDDLAGWKGRILTPIEAYSAYCVGKTYGRSFDSVAPVTLYLTLIGSDNWIVWQGGTLLQADTVNGPWTPVGGASAPYYKITPNQTKKFFRAQL